MTVRSRDMATDGKLAGRPARAAVVTPSAESTVGMGGLVLVLAYATVEFVRPQVLLGPVADFVRPALVLAALLCLYWVRKWGLKEVFADRSLVYSLLFIFFASLWIPFAANNYWAFQVTKSMWMYLLAAAIPLGLVLTSQQRRRQFLGFWILVHLYFSIFVLANNGRGPTGFLQDENDMAYALCMAIPYPIFFAQKRNISKMSRVALLTLALVMFAAIVATHSRGGFIGLAGVVLYIVYLSKRRLRNLLICLAFGVVAFQFVPGSYVERIASITDTEDTSRNERLTAWRIGWDIFLDYPILGVGPSNYAWRSGEYHVALPDFEPGDAVLAGRAAHSLYVALISEYGIVGTAIFVALLVSLMRRLGYCERQSMLAANAGNGEAEANLLLARALKASIIGYLMTGLFLSVLYYPQFWYTLGLVVALSRDVTLRYPPTAVPVASPILR